ncbi:MAG TPA: hypothetical protein VK209_11270 [Candidatus Sulfotelmatobacter sp.]|nr:hypothetical protein [Candidatus Sulfotelmatobacter sp.]
MQRLNETKVGREKLQRIIEMCIAIETHNVDPFMMDVNDIIKVVKQYFPDWKKPEDLNLDAETLHHLASVIKLQSEWVKSRSTSLYADPFILEEKILQANKESMVNLFLYSWHPIVELEQISLHSLSEALRYWDTLLPITERWNDIAPNEVGIGVTSRDELIKSRVLSDKVFSEELDKFWNELKAAIQTKGKADKMQYWDFIGAETYEDTVQRAFLTSFLITYGYASLEVHPLEEQTFIKALEKPQTKPRSEQAISIPIAITYDDWQKWKRGELN